MKPTSDSSLSDSLDKFICDVNATEITSATYYTLCEIKSQVDPESWEEDPDHIESVIYNYELLINKDNLIDWLKEKIELYEGLDQLETFLLIGDTEECDYLNVESFFKDLNCEYVIDVLKNCWKKACTKE